LFLLNQQFGGVSIAACHTLFYTEELSNMVRPICTKYYLPAPKVVAIATDKYLTPKTPFADAANLPGVPAPMYGQDISFSVGRAAPGKQSVGTTEADLRQKMWNLLGIFAKGDKSGMAKRLFTEFLTKRGSVTYFDDPALNLAAAQHPNIKHFCEAALSAPNSSQRAIGKTYIHQALKNAKWDIRSMVVPTNLGVPAFNTGSKSLSTGDFDNGLGVMINGVQYAYVVAKYYDYYEDTRSYSITLRYVFYDVFGLDDDDLNEFGATSDGLFNPAAAVGITAWWQLQHQYGYAPLVTRTLVERSFEVPAE
jgi:hypothetical protein